MKTLSCREAGKDCDYVARGNTESEVIQNAMNHAKTVHGMQDADFTPEMRRQMVSLIREQPQQAAS
ncbi:MAG: DUF1059 domain-containing protein [Bdellovibrionota bacterium]